mgnify:CR=1 FL=1
MLTKIQYKTKRRDDAYGRKGTSEQDQQRNGNADCRQRVTPGRKDPFMGFPALSYEEGIPVYLLKAYADLTSYDIILDARNGNIIKRTERCL